MAESSTPEEMLSSDESSGEVRADIPAHNLILYVTEARVLRVEFTNCQSWPHETSWICLPTPNLSLNKEFCPQLGELKERLESRGEHLTSIHSGSLIFVFGHDTEFKAIQMLARHSEIKKAILLFLHKIGSQEEDISMESVVQKAKRTAKRQRQQKESSQIITGMDGDSTAIHSNVAGTQNVQEMHQELGNIHISGDVSVNINVNCDGSTHETSWHINPAPDKHISQVPMESFHRLGRRISEFCLATLRRVTRGCLIFSFAHSTSEDAIDMIVKHRKVKEVFLDFVQELDPSIEDIRLEVVLRELSVSEEQTTKITGSGSHSSGYTPNDPSLEPLVKGQDSDRRASSDPSQHRRYSRLSTASHATLLQADHDLCFASWDGNLEKVKRLLSQGVDPNCRVRSLTPVMWAARRGHRDVVELLVSRGADMSLVDVVGDNILHLACMGGHVETVKYVLSLNVVDINSRGGWSRTPVMKAAHWEHREVVKLLVSKGADVSLVDEDGGNTLHHACWGGDVETVKFVLSLNVVDINARNKRGRTAADRARNWGHTRVADLLVSRGAQ